MTVRVVTPRELKFLIKFLVSFSAYNYKLPTSSHLEGKSVCLEVTLRVGELEPESFSVYLEQQRYKKQIGALKLQGVSKKMSFAKVEHLQILLVIVMKYF